MSYISEITDNLSKELPNCAPELIDLYVLLVFTLGEFTRLEDVHDAWSIWQSRTKPEHRSIIPFNELSFDVQELDRKYMEAIHKVAREHRR